MNSELSSLISAARSISEDAKTLFGNLSEVQLNWKPDAENWSVGQCLEHLIAAMSKGFPAVESVVNGDYKPNIWAKLPFLPKFFGSQILQAILPENKKKQKAPSAFRPVNSNVSPNIVGDFVANQQKLIELMEATQDIETDKIVISSPAASFITYTLFDAYKISVYHARRHFRQAQNVMKLDGFPS